MLDDGDLREQLADVVGVLGVARDVIGDRGVLAAAEPLGKLLGQPLERVAIRRRFAHGSALGLRPIFRRRDHPGVIEHPERGRADLLEPPQGPDIAVAGRGLVDAQHGGRLAVVELLEVAEGQDLAVDRVHGVERLLDLDLDLGPDGGPARRRQSAEELGGQRSGVGRGQRPVEERDLATGIAALHAEVEAVQRLEPLHGQEAQPEEGRHPRIGGVFSQPAHGIQERLLEHVLGVEPPLKAPVEPEPDHLEQPPAMPREELAERMTIPCMDAAKEGLIGVGMAGHEWSPIPITDERSRLSTGRGEKRRKIPRSVRPGPRTRLPRRMVPNPERRLLPMLARGLRATGRGCGRLANPIASMASPAIGVAARHSPRYGRADGHPVALTLWHVIPADLVVIHVDGVGDDMDALDHRLADVGTRKRVGGLADFLDVGHATDLGDHDGRHQAEMVAVAEELPRSRSSRIGRRRAWSRRIEPSPWRKRCSRFIAIVFVMGGPRARVAGDHRLGSVLTARPDPCAGDVCH